MLIYFGLVLYIILLNFVIGNRNERAKRIYCMLVFLALFLTQALRSVSVGTDLIAYYSVYQKSLSLGLLESIKYGYSINMEPGFPSLLWIIGRVFNNWQWVMVVTSLLINGIVCLFAYHNSKIPFIFFLAYIGLGLFVFSFSGLRQMCAIAFTMLAYMCIVNKKKLAFFISLVFAVLFHFSAIIIIVMIIFRKLDFTKLNFIMLLILMCIIFIFGAGLAKIIVPLVFPKYSSYLQVNSQFGFLGLFFMLTFYMLFIMNYRKEGVNNPLLLYLAAIAACVQLFGNVTTITARLTFYFVPYVALAISNSLNCSSDILSFNVKRTITFCYCAFILLALFLPNILNGYLNISPYDFFW